MLNKIKKIDAFTVVELLVVVVVIGILTSIVVVSYNSIISRTAEATISNDLQSLASNTSSYYTRNGIYPASKSDLATQGYESSDDVYLEYTVEGANYCATGSSSRTSRSFMVTNGAIVAEGVCSGHLGRVPKQYEVVTVAGTGNNGFLNGDRTVAMFSSPAEIAVDDSGDIYVADTNNHKIRKISPLGSVTTLAGSSEGYINIDGVGTAARLRYPIGLTIYGDALYTMDQFAPRLRKITLDGVVTTLAGTGSVGAVDGLGTAASFGRSNINSLAADTNGNIFIADGDNQIIRKVAPDGTVSTYAGVANSSGYVEGDKSVARFMNPTGVVVADSGVIYVTDQQNQKIRKIATDGIVSTITGGTSGVDVRYPVGGAAIDDDGNIYVADSGNNRIWKIGTDGRGVVIAGLKSTSGFVNGVGTAARFNNPTGLAIDNDGNLLVGDTGNGSIRKIYLP